MNTNKHHYHVTTNAPAGVIPAHMEWADNKATAWQFANHANKLGYVTHVTRYPAGDYTTGKSVWQFRLALTK